MNNHDTMIETKDLTHVYSQITRALNSVNLCINSGEFVSIMGPSGSGKTTLLNLIGALDHPTSGEILIKGESLSEIKDLDGFRNKHIGFIFQLHNLIPTLTARENVEIPLYETISSRKERKNRALEVLEIVDLSNRMDNRPVSLSGGERQRVAIARALVNEPELILADEPTGNLDSLSGSEIMEVLKDLNRSEGLTIIVVTHDSSVARKTKRIIELKDGRIVRDDLVQSGFMQDLRDFRYSELGMAIQQGHIPEEVSGLGFNQIAKDFQSILLNVS